MATPEKIQRAEGKTEFGLGRIELALPFPPTKAGKRLPLLSATAACSVGTVTKIILDSMQDFPVLGLSYTCETNGEGKDWVTTRL